MMTSETCTYGWQVSSENLSWHLVIEPFLGQLLFAPKGKKLVNMIISAVSKIGFNKHMLHVFFSMFEKLHRACQLTLIYRAKCLTIPGCKKRIAVMWFYVT